MEDVIELIQICSYVLPVDTISTEDYFMKIDVNWEYNIWIPPMHISFNDKVLHMLKYWYNLFTLEFTDFK